jgi:hypothetical protein
MSNSDNPNSDTFIELVGKSNNLINFDASVTKEDIIAIAMSDWETNLRSQIKELEGEFRQLKNSEKEILKAVENIVNRVQRNFMSEDILKCREALNVFGWSPEIHVDVDYPRNSQVGTVTIDMKMGNSYTNPFNTYRQSVDIPDEILSYYTQLDALDETKDKVCSKLNSLRSELHGIGTKEREARATLARQVLSSTEAGSHLLKKISDES